MHVCMLVYRYMCLYNCICRHTCAIRLEFVEPLVARLVVGGEAGTRCYEP